jgi:hypothetical protein
MYRVWEAAFTSNFHHDTQEPYAMHGIQVHTVPRDGPRKDKDKSKPPKRNIKSTKKNQTHKQAKIK